jgi:hypothetical protein
MSHPHPTTAAQTSPFDRHGIRHLSPSSLGLYRHSPARRSGATRTAVIARYEGTLKQRYFPW